jgi:hypothetical protein
MVDILVCKVSKGDHTMVRVGLTVQEHLCAVEYVPAVELMVAVVALVAQQK